MAERVSSEQLMFKPTTKFLCMYVVVLYSLRVRGIKTDVLLNMVSYLTLVKQSRNQIT